MGGEQDMVWQGRAQDLKRQPQGYVVAGDKCCRDALRVPHVAARSHAHVLPQHDEAATPRRRLLACLRALLQSLNTVFTVSVFVVDSYRDAHHTWDTQSPAADNSWGNCTSLAVDWAATTATRKLRRADPNAAGEGEGRVTNIRSSS